MRSIRLAASRLGLWAAAAALLALAACQANSSPQGGSAGVAGATTEPAMDNPAKLAAIRQMFPDASVGQVEVILPEYHLVAVGDLPVNSFGEGDVFTFVNAHGDVLNHGRVVAKTADKLHIDYDPTGSSAPQVGDLAVKFPEKHQ